MKIQHLFFSILVMPALLTGCKTPTTYSWGHYEDLIYASYASPGKIPPQSQIDQLEKDYQKAKAENKPVPPGFHAQVGYLYAQLGKPDDARREFEAEKASFPESGVFMDRLITNLKKQ
jgi:hypothetical protein